MSLRAGSVCLLLLFPSLASATPPPPERVDAGAALFLLGGVTYPQLDGMSDALAASGHSRLPSRFGTLGIGFWARAGRLLFGAEGHFLPARGVNDGSDRITTSGGFALFDLGIVAIDTGQLFIYPVVGVGTGSLEVRIAPRNAPGFQDVLANPGTSTTLDAGGLLLQPAIGIDMISAHNDNRVSGLLLGLRAGFLFRTGSSVELAGSDVDGAPDMGLTGFFLRVAIGFGVVQR